MRDNTLVYTQVTVSVVKILQKIRTDLEKIESTKKRNRIRITKKEVCEEFIKRCLIKKVI